MKASLQLLILLISSIAAASLGDTSYSLAPAHPEEYKRQKQEQAEYDAFKKSRAAPHH